MFPTRFVALKSDIVHYYIGFSFVSPTVSNISRKKYIDSPNIINDVFNVSTLYIACAINVFNEKRLFEIKNKYLNSIHLYGYHKKTKYIKSDYNADKIRDFIFKLTKC